MINDGTGNWHYLAIKSIFGLLRGITSKHNGDYYCLNCFQSYTTEKKLRKHEKVCENHDFCHLKMPDEDNKILKYVSGEKSLKAPFVIYADFPFEICHICKKEFNNDNKVRDHCHYTGKYRGAAHNKCNLNYKILKESPVVFHNGSTYDYHFIIKQ